jgi:hypothetical protein
MFSRGCLGKIISCLKKSGQKAPFSHLLGVSAAAAAPAEAAAAAASVSTSAQHLSAALVPYA